MSRGALFKGQVIAYQPALAEVVGVVPALVVQQVHHLAGANGWLAISYRTFAGDLGVSKDAITRATKKLKALAVLEEDERDSAGRNRYRLVYPALHELLPRHEMNAGAREPRARRAQTETPEASRIETPDPFGERDPDPSSSRARAKEREKDRKQERELLPAAAGTTNVIGPESGAGAAEADEDHLPLPALTESPPLRVVSNDGDEGEDEPVRADASIATFCSIAMSLGADVRQVERVPWQRRPAEVAKDVAYIETGGDDALRRLVLFDQARATGHNVLVAKRRANASNASLPSLPTVQPAGAATA